MIQETIFTGKLESRVIKETSLYMSKVTNNTECTVERMSPAIFSCLGMPNLESYACFNYKGRKIKILIKFELIIKEYIDNQLNIEILIKSGKRAGRYKYFKEIRTKMTELDTYSKSTDNDSFSYYVNELKNRILNEEDGFLIKI